MGTRNHTVLAATAVIALLATLGACGGGGSDGDAVASLDTEGASDADDATDATTADAPADIEDAMLAFTECIRDHGIDMPDPQISGDGRGVITMSAGESAEVGTSPGPDDEGFQEAQTACEPLMDAVVGSIERDPVEEAEIREELLAFAQCMRDHGIDMPDPEFDADGRVRMRTEVDGPDEDDDVQAASEESAPEGGGMIATPAGGGD